MAYVLGFFAADGNIITNRRGGQYWSIEIKDHGLLKSIQKVIQSDHKIGIRIKGDPITHSRMYRLQIGNVEMCEDLRKLGMKENKTYSLSVPNIPLNYFKHFVRGYFDGDGHVWTGWIHKERKTRTFAIQTVFTSCSLDFLRKLGDILCTFGVEKGVLRKGKGNYYRLTYSINNSLKLYDFMYNNLDTSKLFLKRKKDVFDKYIKMRL